MFLCTFRTAVTCVAAVVAAVAAVAAAQSARADDVFSNLGFQTGNIITVARSAFHPAGFFEGAVPFTVPAGNGFTLTSIEMLVSSPDTSTATIHIYNNTSGAPGTELTSLTLNNLTPTEALLSAAPASNTIVLAPNTVYWVSLTVDITTIENGPVVQLIPHEALWRHVATSGAVALRAVEGGLWNVTGLLQTPSLRVRGTPIPPIGGCCNQQGACYALASDACQAFGGNFLGGGTTCATLCPVVLPTGACCRGTVCTISPPLTCTGRFEGPGSVCQPIAGVNRCCRADFNASGTLSVQDLFDFLNAYFSGCP